MTLNLTICMPPRTKNVSPLQTGQYAGEVISTIEEFLSDVKSYH
jgi:hypothetical protein